MDRELELETENAYWRVGDLVWNTGSRYPEVGVLLNRFTQQVAGVGGILAWRVWFPRMGCQERMERFLERVLR
jgi:hypothetical protein